MIQAKKRPFPYPNTSNSNYLQPTLEGRCEGRCFSFHFVPFHMLRAPYGQGQKMFFLAPNSRHPAADVRGVLFVFSFHALRALMRPKAKTSFSLPQIRLQRTSEGRCLFSFNTLTAKRRLAPGPKFEAPCSRRPRGVVCVLLPRVKSPMRPKEKKRLFPYPKFEALCSGRQRGVVCSPSTP